MEPRILTIKQLNQGIKKVLENNPHLSNIYVKGEISNFTLHGSGHMYFSLKDEGSVIRALMFKWDNNKLKFKPKEGMKVIAKGNINVYEPSGSYQINIKEMKPDGIGDLHLKFEELKEKLSKEGLFSDIHKKTIPQLPKKIGVVTSPTGAAIRDIITTIQRRYPIAEIIISPAIVQGDQAPSSIIKGIEMLNEHTDADVLIVGRGGGSIEDLWGFNDEQVARAIFKSRIPIISAVGHETDFTIADFVADIRAATPTGAAEIATPFTLYDLNAQVNQYQNKFIRELQNNLKYRKEKVARITKSIESFHPQRVLENNYQRLDMLTEKLQNNLKNNVERKSQSFEKINTKMTQLIENKLERNKNNFALKVAKLDNLSPLKIMSRGYSIAFKDNESIKNVNQVKENDNITVKVSNGTIQCTVNDIKEEI